MSTQKSLTGAPGALWKQLTSVKLTVGILLLIAASAIVGTLIPQNRPPAYYREIFGEALYPILTRLNLPDMYHSLWFQALLLLLALNILACSLDRLKAVLKIVFSKTPAFSSTAFGEANATEEHPVPSAPAALRVHYQALLKRHFSTTAEQETEDGLLLFAEKGRYSRLGVYIVHFSILILLAGALIGSIFGFEGYINLPEGQATSHVLLTNSDQPYELGFTVRCDAFSVSFHESGQPKEYRSRLTILDGERMIRQQDILVNKPLRYQGIRIFQSSYGTASAKNISLTFTSRETGLEYRRTVDLGVPVVIPEGLGTFTANRLISEYLFQGQHNIGETLLGTLTRGDQREIVALPLKFSGFDKMRQGDVVISVSGMDPVYFTGLHMRKDPGVPLVYAGFLLLIAGIYVTFFLSHVKCCVRLTAATDGARVKVYCKANKNQLAARTKADWLIKKLTRIKINTNAG
jgi:cytochrome c biogenesis protein